MTKAEKKEIRAVLLGRTVLLDNGQLCSQADGEYRMSNGVENGAGAVRFLGITHRDQTIDSVFDESRTLELAHQQMLHLGRSLLLREQQQTVACLIRYVLTSPVVLTFRFEEGGPVLSAWSGRGLMGMLSRRRALKAFGRRMPEGLSLSGRAAPEETKKKKKKNKKRALKRKH